MKTGKHSVYIGVYEPSRDQHFWFIKTAFNTNKNSKGPEKRFIKAMLPVDRQKSEIQDVSFIFLLRWLSIKIVISQWISSSEPSSHSKMKPLKGCISRNIEKFVYFRLQAVKLFIENRSAQFSRISMIRTRVIIGIKLQHYASLLKTQKVDVTRQRSILDMLKMVQTGKWG